jgi:hypothetical protein
MDEVKHVKFERTGGFAGIRLAAEFDLDDLPADQAKQIREILDDTNFEGLPERILGSRAMPDGFTYAITASAGKRRHSLLTDDGSLPEKLAPLIDLLTQIAREQMMKKK